ncbi:MAG: SgcJ/EcaC family oxidoreductase [Methylobacteriaceae bacterium]|nr:SgcJ/EcaC family oxidoreductase [Methylobacteriaceae bacterium]
MAAWSGKTFHKIIEKRAFFMSCDGMSRQRIPAEGNSRWMMFFMELGGERTIFRAGERFSRQAAAGSGRSGGICRPDRCLQASRSDQLAGKGTPCTCANWERYSGKRRTARQQHGRVDMAIRPNLAIESAEAEAAARAFAAGLQAGHDGRNAEMLNRQFAADVIWGSPYGALIDGYERLHPIHVRFQQQPRRGPAFRYQVRHVLVVREDVAIAHIARLALGPEGEPLRPDSDPNQPFSEMAMYVLVRRDGQWWLAAGQNTPMRPGGAVPA